MGERRGSGIEHKLGTRLRNQRIDQNSYIRSHYQLETQVFLQARKLRTAFDKMRTPSTTLLLMCAIPCLGLLFEAKAGTAADELNPLPIRFHDDITAAGERGGAMKAIKSFLDSALRNDRAAAEGYANKRIYQSPTADRTKLFGFWLDLINEKRPAAKTIYVTHLREVQFDALPGFETTVEIIVDASEKRTDITSIDMIWTQESGVYRCVVLGDVEAKILIKSEQ
jgi:hypothetical protein